MKNNISSINHTVCTGCSACVAVCNKNAISLKANEKGFLYPHINEKLCVECSLCIKACPTNDMLVKSQNMTKVYAVKHKDSNVLELSSSGGLFSAISDYVISKGGVVYGAIHDETLNTIHSRATSIKERNKQRGSKYVQSDLQNTIQSAIKDLRDNRLVLFTGTPCQIAGVSNAVGNSPLRSNLILVDIICNGVPSPLIFKEYIKYCESKYGVKIVEHYHRSKDFGWGHNEKNILENGETDITSDYANAWKRIFYTGNALRECCYNCQYANMVRYSDISIGDFWGIQNTKISIPTKNGVSLCLINTLKGNVVFEEIKKYLIIEEASVRDAINKQPRLRGICASPDNKEKFWSDYFHKGPKYTIEKYGECTPFLIIKHRIKKIMINLHLWK